VMAQAAMALVIAPFALVAVLRRLFSVSAPPAGASPRRDRFDALGRGIFVAIYACLAGAVGFVAGFGDGGWGAIASGLAFALFGVVVAALVPREIVQMSEAESAGEPTDAARAERERARRDGEPTIVLADRVAKRIAAALVGQEKGDGSK